MTAGFCGLKVVFAGSIGRSVTGGQAWASLQYLLGLEALGADVVYLEDAGDWSVTYRWSEEVETWELDHPAGYVGSSLNDSGFTGSWIYRTSGDSRGLAGDDLEQALREADLLIIRGVPFLSWRPEYDLPARRIFIDVDPGFSQFRYERREPAFVETVDRCEELFTVGQNVGSGRSTVPACGRTWHATRPPVYLPAWPACPQSADLPVTAIMRWRGMKDLRHEGIEYGQKDKEFPAFAAMPLKTGRPFSVALTGGGSAIFESGGWQVIEGWRASGTPDQYRNFIRGSSAEFGVAKNCYVATSSGWFSDRSVCYLSSGRPAILQDSGLADWLPAKHGVAWFRTPEDAVDAVEGVYADLESQSRKARELAEEMFSADKVLPLLLERALAGVGK